MGTLLFHEPPLCVSPSLACLIGLEEAVFLQQVNYWLVNAQKANDETKLKDGCWWTYGSAKDWRDKNFPFWSIQTIRRLSAKLEKRGVLLRRDEADPKAKGGCRVWYSIDYQRLERLQNGTENEGVDHSGMINLDIPYDQLDHTFTENITETPTLKDSSDAGASGAGEPAADETPQDETPPPAKKERPRDLVYDDLAEIWFDAKPGTPGFQALGGRIGLHVTWSKGKRITVKRKADDGTTQEIEIDGCPVVLHREQWSQCKRDWQREHPQASHPKDILKFVEWVSVWLSKHTAPADTPPALTPAQQRQMYQDYLAEQKDDQFAVLGRARQQQRGVLS